MLTDADHVWHAMYFKGPEERHRYLKSQLPHADVDHLLRKNNKFPKIYRDDIVVFAVIADGKVIDTVKTREEAHTLAKAQEGYVLVADVPISEKNHPQYDRYYQEIIKTPIVPSTNIEEQDVPDVVDEEQVDAVVETKQDVPDVVDEEQVDAVVETKQEVPDVVDEEQVDAVVETKQEVSDVVEEEQVEAVVETKQDVPDVVEEEQVEAVVETKQDVPDVVEEEQVDAVVEEQVDVVETKQDVHDVADEQKV